MTRFLFALLGCFALLVAPVEAAAMASLPDTVATCSAGMAMHGQARHDRMKGHSPDRADGSQSCCVIATGMLGAQARAVTPAALLPLRGTLPLTALQGIQPTIDDPPPRS